MNVVSNPTRTSESGGSRSNRTTPVIAAWKMPARVSGLSCRSVTPSRLYDTVIGAATVGKYRNSPPLKLALSSSFTRLSVPAHALAEDTAIVLESVELSAFLPSAAGLVETRLHEQLREPGMAGVGGWRQQHDLEVAGELERPRTRAAIVNRQHPGLEWPFGIDPGLERSLDLVVGPRQHERKQKVVPGEDEGEHSRREQTGTRHREYHLPQHLPARAAVYQRAFFQLQRDVLEPEWLARPMQSKRAHSFRLVAGSWKLAASIASRIPLQRNYLLFPRFHHPSLLPEQPPDVRGGHRSREEEALTECAPEAEQQRFSVPRILGDEQ